MRADPQTQVEEKTRRILVRDLGAEMQKAAGVLENGIGLARSALANPLVDHPSLVQRKARLLVLLRDAGALLVLEQAR